MLSSLEKLLISKGLLTDLDCKQIGNGSKSFLEDLRKYNNSLFVRVNEWLKEEFDISYIDLEQYPIEQQSIELISHDVVLKYNVLPVRHSENILSMVIVNPFDVKALDYIVFITGMYIKVYFTEVKTLKLKINKYYGDGIAEDFTSSQDIEEDSSIVKLVNSFIETAAIYNVSDIHIEPFESVSRIRFRVDGRLSDFKIVDSDMHSRIISRLKIMSNMDIIQKRIPQDGYFKLRVHNSAIDFRLSSMPTVFGEKMVIRLIYDFLTMQRRAGSIFFAEAELIRQRSLNSSLGAILVTGSTGSVKTTTLLNFLNKLPKDETNIVTIEDPVENIVFGINQINVSSNYGLSFTNSLKAILRQDPDTIMVGEIREADTARLVIRAAITGHLVLSTLHTDGAISAIIRLIAMGIEDYLVAAAVKIIIFQRLARKLCSFCKKDYIYNKEEADILFDVCDGILIYRAVGCDKCNNTGYKGRLAIYELIEVDEYVSNMIRKASFDNKYIDGIKTYLKSKGVASFKDNAIKNVCKGNTTIYEIKRMMYGCVEI